MRFLALDLADGWIDLTRAPAWRLRHAERGSDLRISMFPVADGVTADLPTVRWRIREERRRYDAIDQNVVREGLPYLRTTLLDEASWTNGTVFCVATRTRSELRVPRGSPRELLRESGPSFAASWTVSDGRHMVEMWLHDRSAEDAFPLSADECDAAARSIRFEGPS